MKKYSQEKGWGNKNNESKRQKMVLFYFSGQPKVGKKRVTNYTKSKNTLKLWLSTLMPSNCAPKTQPIMATDRPVT